MAATFTTLGLAGLFVATVLPGMLGSSTAAPGTMDRDLTAVEAAGSTSEPAATAPKSSNAGYGQAAFPTPKLADAAGRTIPPVRVSTSGGKSGDAPTQAPQVAVGGVDQTRDTTGSGQEVGGPTTLAAPAINPLLAGSLALLGIGLLLFGLRFSARRLR
jgi:hypothetical protein